MASIKKILVAEDEKPMAHALQLKLKNSGYDVEVAYNGEEALQKATKQKFDLVLLDLVMPVLDGFGFMEEMKNKKKKVPIIITSNLSQGEDKDKAKALGANDFLVKSDTSLSQIVNIVNKYFKK